MAFNADEYIDVIVEQIAENFQDLHDAVTVVPQLEKEVDKLVKASEKEPDSLKEREAQTKVALFLSDKLFYLQLGEINGLVKSV